MDAATSFPYTPAFSDPADADIKVPDWLDDPIYYHNRGNSTFSGENSLYGDFFGLDDLFTDARQPGQLFRYLPIYTLTAGSIGFAIGWIVGRNVG